MPRASTRRARLSTSDDDDDGNYRSNFTSSPRGARRPRGQGAARKKDGCYTCRVRRKKCDETPDKHGNCETCVRLHIECLGFGDRRPTWLRAPNNLNDTRRLIKEWLTQQNMVKGQNNGSNGSGTDEDGDILILSPDRRGPRRASSSTPSSSSSNSTTFVNTGAQHFHTSSVRDEVTTPATTQPDLVADSSTTTNLVMSVEQCVIPIDLPFDIQDSSIYRDQDLYPATSSDTPAMHSSYGRHYNTTEQDYEDPVAVFDPQMSLLLQPFGNEFDALAFPVELQPHAKHYFHHVLEREYLLADNSIRGILMQGLAQYQSARQGAFLLTNLHLSYNWDKPTLLNYVSSNAQWLVPMHGCDDAGQAFAALQIVSSFLFLGGRHHWIQYLDHAINWVQGIFHRSPYQAQQTLLQQEGLVKFIIKTTMWFDVLGSITRGHPPRLLQLYRQLFHGAMIEDPNAGESMLNVMGCESSVVLALAEISSLAAWKTEQARLGSFSNPIFMQTGQDIERRYLSPLAQSPPPLLVDGGGLPVDEPAACRRVTSAVFRASARVYLHTVLSGDAPQCPEIARAVQETVDCLARIPPGSATAERAVVRMVVFAICIAGCLTDAADHRIFLLAKLDEQRREVGGNCDEVRRVMEEVWRRREEARARGRPPPSWRDVLADSPDGILLLV